MPRIQLYTEIKAPIDICFDLARNIDMHKLSMAHTRERAIAGVTSGLIGLNESVTWKARHFGVVQQLSARIVKFERPYRFTDKMEKGFFKSFTHIHEFKELEGNTFMIDIFDFETPFGIIGKLLDKFVLNRYMKKLLVRRNSMIKIYAEDK